MNFPLIKETILKSVGNVNPQNVLNIIIKTMAIVDKNTDTTLKGNDKKQLVLSIVYDIVDTCNIPQDTKNYILDIVNNIFDPLVESIIDVSKGHTDINRKKNIFVEFFKRCIHRNSTL